MNVLHFIMHLMHNATMVEIYWPLEVLSRSVHFPNLSTAAEHVGLSQSQLSRVLKQLESYFGFQLLDRKVKRKSMWTAEAHQLSEIFLTHQQRLLNQFQKLKDHQKITELRVVCLEGVANHAAELLQKAAQFTKAKTLRIDVFDLDELEERFLREEYDFCLTIRIPNRAKPKFLHSLGFQTMENFYNKKASTQVLSVFEFHQQVTKQKRNDNTLLVSNSLLARKHWIEKFGGSGLIPSSELKSRGAVEVFLLGHPSLPEQVWTALLK